MAIDTYQIEVKASQFVQKERFDLAIVEYKKILKHNPKNHRIRKTIGDLYLKIGQPKEAERYYLAVVEAYVKERQFKGAIPLYRELIKMRDKDHEMHLEIAHCLLQAGFPTDALIHLKNAVTMTQRLKPDIAQEVQRRVIDLEPENLAERRKLPELLEAANWTDKASDEWLSFAELNRRLEKDKEAARALERAFSLRDSWEARVEAAQARLRAKEPRKALEYLQKIYKDHPTEPRILALLGAGLQEVGQEEKAKQLWLQAASRFKDVNRRFFAYEEALKCGVQKEEIEQEFTAAQYAYEAKNIKLFEREWAEPKSTAEQRFVTKAKLLMEYGFLERALQAISEAEGMEKRLPIFALKTELLIQLDQEEAIELISNFKTADQTVQEHLRQRLFGLGVLEEDSEELIDDDLLEDELLDDDLQEAEIDSSEVLRLFEKVEEEVSTGNIPEAIRLCEEVLALDPSFELAGLRLGELYLLLDDPEIIEEGLDDGFFSEPEEDFGADIFAASKDDKPAFEADFSFDFLEPNTAEKEEQAEGLEANESLFDDFVGDTEMQVSGDLSDAKMKLLVGMFEDVEAMLEEEESLQAGILLAQAQNALGHHRSAIRQLQEKLEEINENHPHFIFALWELGQAYTRGGKIRSANRILDEIEEINSGFRTADIRLWRKGLELLK